jgi:hypothetical protein
LWVIFDRDARRYKPIHVRSASNSDGILRTAANGGLCHEQT